MNQPLSNFKPRKRDKAKAILRSIAPSGNLSIAGGLFGSRSSVSLHRAQSETFKKSKSFTKDIAVLSMAYPLASNSDLKELVRFVVAVSADDSISNAVEICAKFTVQLASLLESHPEDAAPAVAAFLVTVREIQPTSIPKQSEEIYAIAIKNKVDQAIMKIKTSNPLLVGEPKNQRLQNFFDVLDTATGLIIPPLDILKDACELIPIPLLKPLVASVTNLLKAAKQTRSNFGDMREIATIAGEFVVSLAVICSDRKVKFSDQFQRVYITFQRKLHDIAQRCNDLSNLSLFSRFLQQGIHKDDISAIRRGLQSAIDEFQAEIATLGYQSLEAVAQNIDVLSLKNLPSLPSFVGSRNEYLEGSRDHDIEYICNWMDGSSEPVLWVHGAAGLGKSTLVHQLVEHLRSKGRLATFAFLVTGSADNPAMLIRMMSRELGASHHNSIPKIADATRNCDGTHVPLREYLTAYILDPIHSLGYPRQLAIIIDAMDEWPYHETFLKELEHLPSPSPVKFIITSRPTQSVERALRRVIMQQYPLEPVPPGIVVKYFETNFETIEWRGRSPDSSQISKLAVLADGLLVWAATVCSMLSYEFDPRSPIEIVEDIIFSGRKVVGGEQLNTLYLGAFSTLFPRLEERTVLRTVLGGMLILQEKLPVGDFAKLVTLREHQLMAVQSRLRALQTRGTLQEDVVLPASQQFHASLVDFFQQPANSDNPFFIDMSATHLMMAQGCLNFLFQDFLLAYGILKSSTAVLYGIKLYAVKYWPLHLSKGCGRISRDACDLLEKVSQEYMCRWATLFTGCLTDAPNKWANDPSAADKATLLRQIAKSLQNNETALFSYRIHCIEVGIRLQPSDIGAWVELGQSYMTFFHWNRDFEAADEAAVAFRHGLGLVLEQFPEWESQDSYVLERTGDNRRWKFASDVPTGLNAWGKVFSGLADALQIRFKQHRLSNDLDEAVELNRQALALYSLPDPNHATSLDYLAVSLRRRFEQHGMSSDLDEAIELNRRALALRPPPHPDHSTSLSNLANVLRIRFKQHGLSDDLDEAIELNRQTLAARPPSHPDHSLSLNHLAVTLRGRFDLHHSLGDLDEAIELNRQALALRPPPHPDRSISLSNLANALRTRFKLHDSLSDLDEVIDLNRQALALCPPSHPDHPKSLSNLAVTLRNRYEKQGSLDDLDEAIHLHRQALALRSHPHPDRSISLCNLANALRNRFQFHGSLNDIDEAIELNAQALALRPPLHPDRSASLNNLAITLECRFERRGLLNDIEEAVSFYRQAYSDPLLPVNYQPQQRKKLSHALRALHKYTGIQRDLDEAIELEQGQ